MLAVVAASLSSPAASSSVPPHAKRWMGTETSKHSDSMSGDETTVAVTGSGSTEIIIIESNNGGSSATKYWNSQAMAAGQVHQVRTQE